MSKDFNKVLLDVFVFDNYTKQRFFVLISLHYCKMVFHIFLLFFVEDNLIYLKWHLWNSVSFLQTMLKGIAITNMRFSQTNNNKKGRRQVACVSVKHSSCADFSSSFNVMFLSIEKYAF